MNPQRTLREKAFALALLAFLGWTPPLVWVFSIDGTIFGLPILFVYFFLGWAVLIALGAVIARRLCRLTRADEREGEG